MGLFSRHSRGEPAPAGQPPGPPGQEPSRLSVPGLAEYAASQGWRPVAGPAAGDEGGTAGLARRAQGAAPGPPAPGVASRAWEWIWITSFT